MNVNEMQSTEKRTNRETYPLSQVTAGSKPCEFCDGLGTVVVAPSYFGRRRHALEDEAPRYEVCYGCLGSGIERVN